MDSRTRTAFGLLVLAQALHSIEEYVFRLFDVFGLWCYLVPLRRGRPLARAIAWGWAVVELANGVVHVVLAIAKGGYFPGLGTAPLLFASSGWLASRLGRGPRR